MGEAIRILHVDDEPDFGDTVAQFLEREDDRFEVVTETDAKAGLDRLRRESIDCVVSDYRMPGLDGLEFLEAVREERPDVPFLLFTGQGSEEVASDAISAGATDYLQKGGGAEQYELLANRVLNAVERRRSARRAADLERVRALVHAINQALIRASTREEIESRVCEIFSEADPYRFAWIGSVDPDTDRIEPRVSAGEGDEYLDGISVSADEAATGRGPAGRAVGERRVAVSHDVGEDPEFEPWRQAARERGFRAAAGVPLAHGDDQYGVLCVYADRPGAFDDTEVTLLSELGDDVAHAIHAIETRAVLRDERENRTGLIANNPSPIVEFVFDDDVPVVEGVNAAFEAAFEFDADEVVGRTVADVLVPDVGRDLHDAIGRRVREGEYVETDVRRRTATGVREFLLRVIPYAGDERTGGYAWYVDPSGRKPDRSDRSGIGDRDPPRQSLFEAVMETSIDGILVVDDDREYVAWNRQFLDMWGVPEELIGDRSEAAALEWVRDELERPEEFMELVEYLYEHPEEESRDQIRLTDGRTFDRYSAPVEGSDGTHFGRVWFFRDITERKDRERSLERLHGATRDLMAATTVEAVATVGSETAECVLDMPMNGIHLYDPDADALVPVSWSEGTTALLGGPPPTISAGEGLAWTAYSTGEPQIYADLSESDRVMNRETPIRSELHFPLGEHGVLLVASPSPDDFDATDEALARILAANVEVAFDRVEREQELKRQNERLDEFASIVSHDLRNPINVVEGHLELARDGPDGDHLDAIARANDRMRSLVDDLLTLARHGTSVEETTAVRLAGFVESCWGTVQTGGAELRVETDATVRADESRLKQLVENLVRNAIEHGGEDLTVTVGDLDDGTGFYVEDTGPGIPPDERETVFESGYSTTTEGTGFGLAIVERIARAHGWAVEATESEGGGARFEISGVDVRD